MRKLILIFLALPCFGAITNVRVIGSTPREVVLAYVSPSPVSCKLEVSENANFTPLINDVNPAMFAGSDMDFRNGPQGRDRVFVIGAAGTGIKYAPTALDGYKRSRAMQVSTLHYYRLSVCDPTPVTGTFSTSNIAPGDTFPDTVYPVDPAHLGEGAWPFIPWNVSDREAAIDPVTGVQMMVMRNLNEQTYNTSDSPPAFPSWVYDDATTWTNPNNVKATDGALATTTANNPLRAHVALYNKIANGIATDVQLEVVGLKDVAGTTADACLTLDGNSCYGRVRTIPFTTSLSTFTMGDPTGSRADMFAYWLNPAQRVPMRTELMVRQGQASNVGNVLTLTSNSNSSFDPRWNASTHFIYNGVDYTVVSVTSGTVMTISGSPADGTAFWSAANFGFIVKKTSAGGSISIDSLKVSYYLYNTQPLNGGSGSILPCSPNDYPEGWRIGGPAGGTTLACTNTSPISCQTTSNHDLVTNDVVRVHSVRGIVAANGTWPIVVTGANTFTLTGSNGIGSGTFPSDVAYDVSDNGGGVVYRSGGPRGAAQRGKLCFAQTGAGGLNWYWVDFKAKPLPDIRFMGPTYTYPHHGLGGIPGFGGVIAGADPDIPVAIRILNIAGADEIWSGPYIGNPTFGMFHDVGTNTYVGSVSDVWAWQSLTPAPNTMSAKISAFDARAAGKTWGLTGIMDGGYMFLTHVDPGRSQNGIKYYAVYDAINNQAVGYMDSLTSANCRWCGDHTTFAFPGLTNYAVFVTYNLGGQADGALSSYDGPYRMSPTAPLNATTDIGDCATKLAAIGQPNPLNVTGNICSTITVASTTPITPSFSTPANDTRGGTIRVGDDMLSTTANGFVGGLGIDDLERMKILGISGNTLVVSRANPVAKAIGWFLSMLCYPVPRFWDFIAAPHGETGTDPYSQNLAGIFTDPAMSEASHLFVQGPLAMDDSGGGLPLGTGNGPTGIYAKFPGFTCSALSAGTAPYAMRLANWPNHLNAPLSSYGCTMANPGFDGLGGVGNGEDLEKHPSPIAEQPLNKSFLDARPMGSFNVMKQQTVTKVGTYVYKLSNWACGISNCEGFDDKRNVALVPVGHRGTYDVSASGFILPDTLAYGYTRCLVHVAGECWAGSQPGELYVNTPKAAGMPSGNYAGGTWTGQLNCAPKGEPWSDLQMDDICATKQPAYGETITQYSSANDPNNTGARRITSGAQMPRTSNNLWNSPPTTDGNWIINWGGIVQGWGLTVLIKVPPYPGTQRGTNRNSWIPIPVKIANVPTGTNNVQVEFGYNPSFHCASRQESCIANAATIQAGNAVYSYSTSDAPGGLACASGCTPVIPALSQRVMWSRIKYRNASNAVIFTSPVAITVTP